MTRVESGEPQAGQEPRAEGSGRRRSRGGRGRDRDRAPRDGELNAAGESSPVAPDSAEATQHDDLLSPGQGHTLSGQPDATADHAGAMHEQHAAPMETAAQPPEGGEPEAEEPMGESESHAHRDAVTATAQAPAPAQPAAALASAPAPAASYALPMDSLVAVAESAGLQWVNSDADKIRSAQAAMAASPPEIRVPREIRKPEAVDEGPLVLVETKKDLSQIKLPFEQRAKP